MDTSSQGNNDIIGQSLDLRPLNSFETVLVDKSVSRVQDDFEYARGNMISILDKGNEALSDMLDFAQQSQHPRGYEVVAALIKTLAETNKDLLELSKKKKDIEGVVAAPTNVNNNLFVGSTSDLLKMLKSNGD